jgi:hypothetical protein
MTFRTALALAVLCGVAYAEPAPDKIADVESREANLESKEPRDGVTFAIAGGSGILGGDGIGTGGALSIRLGHVATRTTVITLELSGSGARHKGVGMDDPVLTDTNAGLLVGAQRYASRSTWVRIAGGLDLYNKDFGGPDRKTSAGVGGLVGGGLDFVRWGYLVLGGEVFGMAGVTRDGMKVNTGFLLGLSYY